MGSFAPRAGIEWFAGAVGQSVDARSAVGQLRWFLFYAGLPALLALAIPAVLPAVRPGDGPAIVEWPWLAGMALGVLATAGIVMTRAATRLHEFWRQLLSRQFDLRQIIDLHPDRLDPHANVKNILVIVVLIMVASYVDQYFDGNRIKALFTAAFSICVMLGVVATFVTYLGTRARTTRVVVVSTLVALVAAAGCLRYEVEVRDLDPWYPSALAQLQDRLLLRPKRATSGGPARSLEAYQKSINPHLASLESFRAREQLLGRWAQSFQKPGSENTGTVKPVLVVVATSGGALRAAIWTETVLGYLDDKIPDFHHHVRVMTGASGGMLGRRGT